MLAVKCEVGNRAAPDFRTARQLHITENFTLINEEKSWLGIKLELADQRVIDLRG
jgi:hypothetical protein